MTGYNHLLMTHLTLVLLSGGFFLLRGIWMITESQLLQAKPVRILPHVIDTFLLLSGFSLAYLINSYPFTAHWLTAKLLLLIAYIGLGVFALKRGKTKSIRIAFLAAALCVYAFMISIAITKSPLGMFSGLIG